MQSYSQFGQLEADAVATLIIHKEMTLTAFDQPCILKSIFANMPHRTRRPSSWGAETDSYISLEIETLPLQLR